MLHARNGHQRETSKDEKGWQEATLMNQQVTSKALPMHCQHAARNAVSKKDQDNLVNHGRDQLRPRF